MEFGIKGKKLSEESDLNSSLDSESVSSDCHSLVHNDLTYKIRAWGSLLS